MQIRILPEAYVKRLIFYNFFETLQLFFPNKTTNFNYTGGKKLFHFDFVSINGISKIINTLNNTKKMNGAILIKIVKVTNKQICKDLGNFFN